VLRSPYRGTYWPGPTLRVADWTDENAVRGVAGIHAMFRGSLEWASEFAAWRLELSRPGAYLSDAPLVLGRIRGSGHVAVATRDIQGFRAEVATVDLLIVPWYLDVWVKKLGDRYQCPIWIVSRDGVLKRVVR
jgi:hypothetical protein